MKKLSAFLIIFTIVIGGCTSKELTREEAIKLLQQGKYYPRLLDYDIYCGDPHYGKKVIDAGLEPLDALKSHYVLEFLNLKEDSRYSESDLETAIIDKLEHFMLKLGKGFLFAGRQRRFTFEGDSFFVDLVFYNRLLRCFILSDLKIGKLTHQDIGQMQMYVNYYDRMVKTKEEKPTIGIILCKEENKTVVEFTLPRKQ